MRDKICCLIGHNRWCFREDMTDAVYTAIEDAIHDGVNILLNLWRTGFDYLCALIIDALKDDYPQIRQIEITDVSILGDYNRNLFDFSFPSGLQNSEIKDVEKWVIDTSGHVIFFVQHDMGSTSSYLHYAENCGLKIHQVYLPPFYYRIF